MTDQQQLPSMLPMERHRTERMESALRGACAELARVQGERDALRSAIERALHDLREGWPEAALDALAGALMGAA